MKIVVFRDENIVELDGVPAPIDCSALPADVHSITWDDKIAKMGWVSYVKPGQEATHNVAFHRPPKILAPLIAARLAVVPQG